MRSGLALVVLLAACGGELPVEGLESPLSVPPVIAVADGHHAIDSYRAVGFQVYECREGSWAFRAPAAILLGDDGALVAVHFGGVDAGLPPGAYWQSALDGSRVLAGNAVASPNPGNIPLLRLQALDHAGEGVFSDVTYIQRLETSGGVGPTGSCRRKARAYVPYQAAYVFWAASLTRPEVPEAIAVPEGHDVARVGAASGVQIYECTADTTWKLRAPSAVLVDDEGEVFATHFGGVDAGLPPGPYWESVRDGSRVLAGGALASASPGTIPHLRLTALGTTGNGILSRVSFIHRLATTGGMAPAGACDPGARAEIPYTADYYFYVPAGQP